MEFFCQIPNPHQQVKHIPQFYILFIIQKQAGSLENIFRCSPYIKWRHVTENVFYCVFTVILRNIHQISPWNSLKGSLLFRCRCYNFFYFFWDMSTFWHKNANCFCRSATVSAYILKMLFYVF